uniref:tRNA-binding domain-containing protein n=1 Tax=Fibrocapsa japonica TaxID=94617 RepID=A0A7S2V4I0_9STRA
MHAIFTAAFIAGTASSAFAFAPVQHFRPTISSLQAHAPKGFSGIQHIMMPHRCSSSALFNAPEVSEPVDTDAKEEAAAPAGELNEFSRLEIRVGKIVDVSVHPDADGLYVEKIDCGEDEPRTIVSGLVKYLKAEDLLDRSVVVLANLKPRAMRGITSHGMLLCASNEDHSQVVPLSPPESSVPGELITVEGTLSQPLEPCNRASKAFDKVAKDLYVNDDLQATFDGKPFLTPNGPCTSTMKGAIS